MVRVLVVEDNDTYREALELVLGLAPDLDVTTARDGARALHLCVHGCPDVALVDYRLPDLDGVEVTVGIRAACPQTAIVGLTAVADVPEVEAMLAAGARACLTKDGELREIVAAIREAAGGTGR